MANIHKKKLRILHLKLTKLNMINKLSKTIIAYTIQYQIIQYFIIKYVISVIEYNHQTVYFLFIIFIT